LKPNWYCPDVTDHTLGAPLVAVYSVKAIVVDAVLYKELALSVLRVNDQPFKLVVSTTQTPTPVAVFTVIVKSGAIGMLVEVIDKLISAPTVKVATAVND
jgi:hypothetical protein